MFKNNYLRGELEHKIGLITELDKIKYQMQLTEDGHGPHG